MKPRPHISVKTKVSIAILQAALSRPMHGVTCPLCREELGHADERILEHMTPHELEGASDTENLRWVHKACAAKKTRGCEGTSKKSSVADGDTHKIAKAKRIADGGKVVRHPMPKTNRKIATPADPWGKEYRAKRAQQ